MDHLRLGIHVHHFRFRWQPKVQSFGMTQAETAATLSSVYASPSAFFASLPTLTLGWPFVGSAQAAPDWTTFFESPGRPWGRRASWIVLSSVVVRDKASHQTKIMEVWLRWVEIAQGLQIVAANS